MFCHYWRDTVVALFMLTQNAVNFAGCGVQIKFHRTYDTHRIVDYLDLEEGEAAAVSESRTVHHVWHTECARLTKSDRSRHGRRTEWCTVSFWGCRCPTPDSSHYWLMWGDCRLGSGTIDWMRTATGWLQSAECWLLTDTDLLLMLRSHLCVNFASICLSIHWIRNIRKFQCFIWFKYQKYDRNYTATFKTITITLRCNWINYYLIMNEGT